MLRLSWFGLIVREKTEDYNASEAVESPIYPLARSGRNFLATLLKILGWGLIFMMKPQPPTPE
jgi:hypothetical protein